MYWYYVPTLLICHNFVEQIFIVYSEYIFIYINFQNKQYEPLKAL